MRFLLVIAALLAALCVVGWISFSATESSATVTIDPEEIRKDTQQAAAAAQEAIRRVDAAITTEEMGRDSAPPEVDVNQDSTPQAAR